VRVSGTGVLLALEPMPDEFRAVSRGASQGVPVTDQDLGAFARALMRDRLAALVDAVRDRASSTPAGSLPERLLYQCDDLWAGFAFSSAGADVPHHDMRESMMRMVMTEVIEALPLVELALLTHLHWEGPADEWEDDWPEQGLPHPSTLRRWLAEALWPILEDAAREDGRRMLREVAVRAGWIAEE
jgi:hypothetical protein